MKTTMNDIAKMAGVSRSTVSRVLSGNYKKIRISAETAETVLRIAQEHDFQPDHLAKSLQSRKTKTIGVIVTDITNPFFAEIARSIEKFLDTMNYSMILCNTDEKLDAEAKGIKLLLSKRVEGLIICPAGFEDENIARLAKISFPFVLIDRYVKGADSSYVVSDNYNGAKQAVEYLLNKGHRRIGFLGGKEDSSSNRDRKKGYYDALEDKGIEYSGELELNLGFDKESGEKGMDLFLKLKNRPTAVFAVNNFLGLGALLSLKKHGINMPGEISLIEFDETDLSRFGDTAVTSINQNAKEIGAKAVEIILSKISGGEDEKIIIPVKLIERQSVKDNYK
ncbi:MAG: LacI family DNA-binding transcriptional regulator [Candidatus Firestonebacteria bacterium]